MKKQPRKLRIDSQTIRPLADDQIRDVHGGWRLSQFNTVCNTCFSGDVSCVCDIQTAHC